MIKQQYLPFTVLKRTSVATYKCIAHFYVATVLTVYGIETLDISKNAFLRLRLVATVPTVYGMRRRV